MLNQRSKVKPESDFTYTNKFMNRKLRFSPSREEVVATFQPTAQDVASDVMRASSLPIRRGPNVQRGFAVFQAAPGGDATDASAALTAQPVVANALPAMIDEEGNTRYFLPDELTVQFKEGVSREQALQVISGLGAAVVTEQRSPGYFTISVPDGKGLFETLEALSSMPEVAFAEPSEAGFDDALAEARELAEAQDFLSEPLFQTLWGLHNTGQIVNGVRGTADADIDAPHAWTYVRGDPDVVLTPIDTGMELAHPDLAPNLLARGVEDWDFADAGDPSPDDLSGHGTHVAGTAAASENGRGVVGVAPRCRLMPLRVDLTAGVNQNRADAINFVAEQARLHPERRYVVNCSWKMSGDHAGVHNAIINAVNRNVLVVFAAANDSRDIGGTPPAYPAIYPEVMAVAATDQNDHKASFSNFGAKISVCAPGVNIESSYLNGQYAFLDGTSMASPHVAGLGALLWSKNRTLSVRQIRELIEGTCDDIDAKNPGFAGRLGKGRINAGRALAKAPYPPLVPAWKRKIPFPQKNAGSSTALALARMQFGSVQRAVLLFLTQKPYSEKIFFVDPTTGQTIRSIDPVGNDTIGSMEWDGRNILVANVTTGAGSINRINPASGAQVGSFPVPPGRGEGMAFDGTYIFYSTVTHIHVIAAATGRVRATLPAPGGDCHALAFVRGYLVCGSGNGVVTVFDLARREVRGRFAAPGTGTARCEGLAYNALTRELFVANQAENTIYVGRLDL